MRVKNPQQKDKRNQHPANPTLARFGLMLNVAASAAPLAFSSLGDMLCLGKAQDAFVVLEKDPNQNQTPQLIADLILGQT